MSDSLFQLNLGLHTLRSSLQAQSPEIIEVEAELGRVYAKWQGNTRLSLVNTDHVT